MQVLQHPNQLMASPLSSAWLLASLSSLLQQRLAALTTGSDSMVSHPDDADLNGYIVVTEPGDDVADLETALGCPLLSDWFGDSRFGDADFAPSFDTLDNHVCCFELSFCLNDDSYTVVLLVPKLTGIDERLLLLCRQFAESPPQ